MGSCNSDLGLLVCVVNALQMSSLTIEKKSHHLKFNHKLILSKQDGDGKQNNGNR